MDLKALKAKIAQAAYAVRGGDESKREELKALRQKHRELCGVVQPEAPKPAPAPEPEKEEPKEESAPKDKKQKKPKEKSE